MRTANPALGPQTFANHAKRLTPTTQMTIMGTVHKSAILLGLLVLTATWSWQRLFAVTAAAEIYPLMLGGAVGSVSTSSVRRCRRGW
ncbi:MAG: Bax inhibitor-1/YccA family membrane protein [Polyangiales bacterium]